MGVAAARAWRRWLAPVLVAVALCWPALLNGQAFLFSDTPAYVKGAAAGFEKFLHLSSPWLVATPTDAGADIRVGPAPALGSPQAPPAADFESSPGKKGVLAGRSVYYGAFVLAAYDLAGLWAPCSRSSSPRASAAPAWRHCASPRSPTAATRWS